MSCFLEKCKNCKEFSSCPLLNAVLQRSYANRTLDNITDVLIRIEELLNGKTHSQEQNEKPSENKT